MKESIKQSFIEIANELEKMCGDWKNLPDIEADIKLQNRILEEVYKKIIPIEDRKK